LDLSRNFRELRLVESSGKQLLAYLAERVLLEWFAEMLQGYLVPHMVLNLTCEASHVKLVWIL